MKKKIKTVDDIKHCEENGLIIFSDKRGCSWEFLNNVWCQCVGKFVCFYNSSLNIKEDQLYYYEEQEQQEATEKDVGKLCWFYDTAKMNNRKVVGKLREVLQDDNFPFRSDYGIPSIHCRPLTKEEIKEFMEKAE